MMLRIVSFSNPLFGFLWIFDRDKYLGYIGVLQKQGFLFYARRFVKGLMCSVD